MTWPIVRIGEIAEVVGGATPRTDHPEYWEGDIPWVTPADLGRLHGMHISRTARSISALGAASSGARVLPAQSVLLSSRAPIGHVAVATTSMASNQGLKSFIVDSDRIDVSYLYWWLVCSRDDIQAMGVGATFKEISKATAATIPVRLPPMDVQRLVGSKLNQIERLRDLRFEQMRLLDALQESIFHGLFGRSHWPEASLRDLGKVSTGGTPPGSGQGMYGESIPFVTPGDLESGTSAKRWLSVRGAAKSRTAAAGSTLVCCIGATIGKVGLAESQVAFNQQINAVEWGPRILPDYGFAAVRRLRGAIVSQARTTTLPILKKSLFEQLRIEVPPIGLQTQYAAEVRRVSQLRRLSAQHGLRVTELQRQALASLRAGRI